MASNEEKVSKFVQAITAYAEEQRDNIRQETEAYKAERLKKAEQEVLTDAYQLIQKETAEMRSENVREISRRDLAARKEVLEQRRKIMADVFNRVEQKLNAYIATPAYTEKLRGMFKEMAAVLPADGTVYYFSKQNEAIIKELSDLCPAGSRMETTEEIRIGGIRGVNSRKGRLMDNTLDAKLEAQYDWFTKTSGLTIE